MEVSLLFWILMLIWLLAGANIYRKDDNAKFSTSVPDLLVFAIVFILGWKVLGWPIKG